jgi:hypothetical protein
MIESGWRMDLGAQGREMWRKMLLPYDAELGTRAVVELVQQQRERPAIADLRGRILKLKVDERESEPLPDRMPKPSWVVCHAAARAADDYRHFVEQIPGLAELDEQYEDGRYAVPEESYTDEKVWVQIGEYGYSGCAYDFAAPPDNNRLCAMHPDAKTKQPLRATKIGKHTFMLCLDCQTRYLARKENEEVLV